MTITQQQIALEANVSRSTVAAVMSPAQCERISPEVRERVMQVAERLGYYPNRYAQVMSRGKSGLIGVVTFSTPLDVSRLKAAHATRLIIDAGYEVIAQDAGWIPATSDDLLGDALCKRLLNAKVEGVILVYPDVRFSQRHVDRFLKLKIPVVRIAGDHLEGVPAFISDRVWGYYQMTRHLIELGRKDFVLLASNVPSSIDGFGRAIAECPDQVRSTAVLHPRSFVQLGRSENHYRYGKVGLERALQQGLRPDALVCSNDVWALGAMTAACEAGIAVPEELAITGFDNEPAGGYGAIPLTTVMHPIEEIARCAVEELFHLIRTKAKVVEKDVLIKGELLVRKSCGSALSGRARAAHSPAF